MFIHPLFDALSWDIDNTTGRLNYTTVLKIGIIWH